MPERNENPEHIKTTRDFHLSYSTQYAQLHLHLIIIYICVPVGDVEEER